MHLPRSFLRPTGRSQALKHIDTVWAYYTGNPDATKPDPMCDDNIAFHIDNWATYTTAQYHPTISSFLRMTLAETLNDAVVSSSCWLQSQRCSHKCVASTCTSTLCKQRQSMHASASTTCTGLNVPRSLPAPVTPPAPANPLQLPHLSMYCPPTTPGSHPSLSSPAPASIHSPRLPATCVSAAISMKALGSCLPRPPCRPTHSSPRQTLLTPTIRLPSTPVMQPRWRPWIVVALLPHPLSSSSTCQTLLATSSLHPRFQTAIRARNATQLEALGSRFLSLHANFGIGALLFAAYTADLGALCNRPLLVTVAHDFAYNIVRTQGLCPRCRLVCLLIPFQES